MIVFTWTPPHFWSLAIHRRDDLCRRERSHAARHPGIAFHQDGYPALSADPDPGLSVALPDRHVGLLYLIGGLALNLGFCWHGWLLKYSDRPGRAMRTFRFSIYHLMFAVWSAYSGSPLVVAVVVGYRAGIW